MKNYTITVNGTAYDVTVEEKIPDMAAPKAATQDAAQSTASTPSPTNPSASPIASSATSGRIEVKSGAAGKVFKVQVGVGKKVTAGDVIIILEAMKMEIPVVAPQDGVVATLAVNEGDTVEAGTILATLN